MREAATIPDPAGEAAVAVPIVCDGGPGAGMSATVGIGRHVVGRAPTSAIRIADRTMELHHLLLDVGTAGGVRVHQLTGRTPCRIDGVPVAGAAGSAVAPGAVVSVGSSRLRVGERELSPVAAADAGHPAASGDSAHGDDVVIVPAARSRPGRPGSSPAVIAVAGGLAAAVVTPWLGPVATAAVALGFALIAVRRRVAASGAEPVERDALVALDRTLATHRSAWLDAQRARTPGLADVLAMVASNPSRCWERSDRDGRMFSVSLGVGPHRWEPAVEVDGGPVASSAALELLARAGRVEDAPVAVDLGPGRSLTVSGPGAGGVVRSLICQLAVLVGPDQWRLTFADGEPAWAAALPHVAAARPGDGHHVVAVVERPELTARPPAALRRSLALGATAAIVIVDEDGSTLLSGEGGRLDLGTLGAGRWRASPGLVAAQDVHAAGLDPETAARAAVEIGRLGGGGAVPGTARLAALAAGRDRGTLDDTIGVAAAWRTAPRRAEAWLGLGAGGVATVDLDSLRGPIGVVGRAPAMVDAAVATIVTSLAASLPPDAIEVFALRTRRAGRAPSPWLQLPHVVAAADVGDPPGELAMATMLGAALDGAAGRAVVVVDAPAPTAGPLAAVLADARARGAAASLHLVVAATEPDPFTDRVLADPEAVVLVLALDDPALARRAAGDTRPCRLATDAAILRAPGRRAELVRLPSSDDDGFDVLTGAIRHAAALSTATPAS